MSGLEQVIIGYRIGDPRIAELWHIHGRVALPHKGCANCGQMCYFVESGQDALRTRDPVAVCDDCWQDPTVKQAIYREL